MTTEARLTFTPGPWRHEPFVSQEATWLSGKVYASNGRVVAYLRPEHGDAPDAHLIAAAPELYEALDALLVAINVHANCDCPWEGERTARQARRIDHKEGCYTQKQWAARAALRKADGR